jgi:hypothetical protein
MVVRVLGGPCNRRLEGQSGAIHADAMLPTRLRGPMLRTCLLMPAC